MLAIAPAVFVIAVSFGVLARDLGWGVVAPIVASVIVFSGSAQFALAEVLEAGGTALAAIVAAILVNARFAVMGVAVASIFRGGPLRRALEAQTTVDASWALANQGEGRFDRELLMGATLPQYVAWWPAPWSACSPATSSPILRRSASTSSSRRSSCTCSSTSFGEGRTSSRSADRRRDRAGAHSRVAAGHPDHRGLCRGVARPAEAAGVTAVWTSILVVAVANFAIKAAGPCAAGRPRASAPVVAVIALLGPALLMALVVVGTFSDGSSLRVDAQAAGVAVAGGSVSPPDTDARGDCARRASPLHLRLAA